MSGGLPKGVAGQKVQLRSTVEEGCKKVTSTHDRTSCVTNIQATTASGMFMGSTMNFGYMPQAYIKKEFGKERFLKFILTTEQLKLWYCQ